MGIGQMHLAAALGIPQPVLSMIEKEHFKWPRGLSALAVSELDRLTGSDVWHWGPEGLSARGCGCTGH